MKNKNFCIALYVVHVRGMMNVFNKGWLIQWKMVKQNKNKSIEKLNGNGYMTNNANFLFLCLKFDVFIEI